MPSVRAAWLDAIRDDRAVTRDRLLVALVVATEARMDGTNALMSSDRLAAATGLSNATVRRRVSELLEQGWLTLAQRGGYRGPNKAADANIYALSQPLTQVSDSVGESTAHTDDSHGSEPLTQVSVPSSSTRNPARQSSRAPRCERGAIVASDGFCCVECAGAAVA